MLAVHLRLPVVCAARALPAHVDTCQALTSTNPPDAAGRLDQSNSLSADMMTPESAEPSKVPACSLSSYHSVTSVLKVGLLLEAEPNHFLSVVSHVSSCRGMRCQSAARASRARWKVRVLTDLSSLHVRGDQQQRTARHSTAKHVTAWTLHMAQHGHGMDRLC